MGNLSTPKTVQKLQKALHAKAKAEAGYRFYALYDKIGREDILAHAYAQYRSNKGAPGVDGQDFADIEAYGVQRWRGELALAGRTRADIYDGPEQMLQSKADTLMQDRSPPARRNHLQRTAGPYIWVIRHRPPVAEPEAKSAVTRKLTLFQRPGSCFSPSRTEEYDHARSRERDPRAP